jgi:hypothetical protein
MRLPIAAIACLLALFPAAAQHRTPQSDYGEPNGTLPNWEERAMAQLVNRARVQPSIELAGCSGCLEAACYSPTAPLFWNYDLNQAARFHSTTMGMFPFFAHETPCALFSDIDSRFPGTSNGSFASSCSSSGLTDADVRVGMFGAEYMGENAAAGHASPHAAFYAWLHETTNSSACAFSSSNGHRFNILTSGPALGNGYAEVAGSPWVRYWTQDFGGSGAIPKIPSGSHWTAAGEVRNPSPGDNGVEFWANWYDPAGAPVTAAVVLNNVPHTRTPGRAAATNGAYSATVNGVSSACHLYSFSFVDSSLNTVRYPTTGNLGFGAGCPDYSSVAAPSAPTGVNAIATTSTNVHVTWNAVTGATSYEVYRRNPGSNTFALRGTPLTTSYNDTASAGVAYLYRVRAVNAGGSSADSTADPATTVMFTSDPLTAGLLVSAVHLGELRTAVDAVRAQAGQSAGMYTNAAAAGVLVKAIHITELRSYLDQAMTTLGLATGGWTDSTLNSVSITATHFQEVRTRVK